MIMSNAPEEFDSVRKLLKLKRYEQPPPRFFDELPARVLNAIEAAPAQASAGFFSQVPVLSRFFALLEQNALVAGSLVTGLCALLIGGVVYSEVADQAVPTGAESASFAAMNLPAPTAQDSAVQVSSMNPILPATTMATPKAPSLFTDTANSLSPQIERVTFTVGP